MILGEGCCSSWPWGALIHGARLLHRMESPIMYFRCVFVLIIASTRTRQGHSPLELSLYISKFRQVSINTWNPPLLHYLHSWRTDTSADFAAGKGRPQSPSCLSPIFSIQSFKKLPPETKHTKGGDKWPWERIDPTAGVLNQIRTPFWPVPKLKTDQLSAWINYQSTVNNSFV